MAIFDNSNHEKIHDWHFVNIGKQTGENYLLVGEINVAVYRERFIEVRVKAAFIRGFNTPNHIMKLLNSGKEDGL